jgi:AraC-like DNA-binding protein
LRDIFEFIESNYHQPIGLNEIAQAFGYSPSYLTSLVRRLTGQTVYQWIIQRRMYQARHLLLKTDLAVHEIAEAVGYVDTGHFVKHFRQLHKQPPKTWRKAQRNL